MIETRQALYFSVVAEELHFGRAAERLRMSQSPLSQAVRQLERQLGVTLLLRTTREVRLTNAGEQFLVQCRLVLAAAEHAESIAIQASSGLSGTLRIGTVTSAFASPLPDVLAKFRSTRPLVVLRVRELDTPQGLQLLRRGELDVAIIRYGGNAPGLVVSALRRDRLVLAVPSLLPLSPGPGNVDLEDFADADWIWLPREISPEYHDELVAACRSSNFSPTVEHWANSIASQLAMVACGLGVTLVPHSSATPHPGIRYLQLRSAIDLVELALVHRRPAGPLVEHMVHCAQLSAVPVATAASN